MREEGEVKGGSSVREEEGEEDVENSEDFLYDLLYGNP